MIDAAMIQAGAWDGLQTRWTLTRQPFDSAFAAMSVDVRATGPCASLPSPLGSGVLRQLSSLILPRPMIQIHKHMSECGHPSA